MKVIIIFRYDDYTATSPIDVEKKLFGIFNKFNKSITIGVVPFVTNGSYHDYNEKEHVEFGDVKVKLLKNYIAKRCIDIALHGFNHRKTKGNGIYTEFAGTPYKLQFDKIYKGKKEIYRLFKTEVKSFIPPWNTYDINTIKSLVNNQFKCISANRYGPYSKEFILSYLPITVDYNDLKKAVFEAMGNKDSLSIISVLLHPYDFEGSNDSRAHISWKNFENTLKWLSHKEEVQILSISQVLSKSEIDVGFSTYKANKPGIFENIYPKWVKTTTNEFLYKTANVAAKLKLKKNISIFLFYIIVAFIVFSGVVVVKFLFLKKEPAFYNIVEYISIIFFSLLSIRSLINKKIYFRTFLMLLFLLSIFCGLVIDIF